MLLSRPKITRETCVPGFLELLARALFNEPLTLLSEPFGDVDEIGRRFETFAMDRTSHPRGDLYLDGPVELGEAFMN